MQPAIKVLCLMEATTVTGPAKNLLKFARLARSSDFEAAGLPRVEVSIATFYRADGEAKKNGHGVNDSPNAFVAAAREQGVNIHVIDERFLFDPKVIGELRRVVAQVAPHAIQTHGIKSHFLVKLSGLGRQYPWVAYHHGYTTTDLKMRGYNQLNRWSLPSATRVITVCQAFATQLSRAGVPRDHIRVCHNSVVGPRPVTSEERQALKTQLGIANDERLILSVGRLSKEKGHVDLVRSIALVRELNADLKFKLVIVGEGPERGQLHRTIHSTGLTDHIVFVGQTKDVAPYYAIAGVLVLPSHSEGSPNVLLEAMAGGVPVVATSVGGVPEIAVAEETALLVPARDPRLLADALQRLLTTPQLAQRLSANAQARVRTHFSPEVYAQSLIRIYQELLPNSTHSNEHYELRLRGSRSLR